MPKEMIVALSLIFALFALMIIRIRYLLRQENKSKGGKRMGKHYNGRFFW